MEDMDVSGSRTDQLKEGLPQCCGVRSTLEAKKGAESSLRPTC